MPAACKILQSSEIVFAESESCITSLDEAANLLNLEELKTIAKEAKCTGSNKAELVTALKKASGGQVGLGSKGQLKLSFDKKGNYVTRDSHFVRKILEKTGTTQHFSSYPDPAISPIMPFLSLAPYINYPSQIIQNHNPNSLHVFRSLQVL